MRGDPLTYERPTIIDLGSIEEHTFIIPFSPDLDGGLIADLPI